MKRQKKPDKKRVKERLETIGAAGCQASKRRRDYYLYPVVVEKVASTILYIYIYDHLRKWRFQPG